MSDLNDILDDIEEQNEQLAAMHLEEPVKRAREELELLREEAFELIDSEIHRLQVGLAVSKQCAITDRQRRVLQYDPERAKRMGLEWAL